MSAFKKLANLFLLGGMLLTSGIAGAGEGGEGGGGGSKDMLAKVEAIVVNLNEPTTHYLQIEMTLKLAKPDVAEKIKLYMPVIRHKLILLLSSKNTSQLESIEGKRKLVEESKRAINQALELSEKEGVTDVLFNSFIIQ